jgi:uncharacterized protein
MTIPEPNRAPSPSEKAPANDRDVLRGGAMHSVVLRRGETLRLTATARDTNVAALFFNADQPLERYNMPDTLKAQHTAFLTKGHVLYSDMGRILVSVSEDGCGWHDTLCGTTDAAVTREKYGESSFQQSRNDFFRNGQDNFLIEMSKYGLGFKDLGPNVNFFSKVWVDDEGNLHFDSQASQAGQSVELRAEMDILVLLSNTPHPMNPDTAYRPPPVEMDIRWTGTAMATDACRLSCPENGRGYQNTEAYFRG